VALSSCSSWRGYGSSRRSALWTTRIITLPGRPYPPRPIALPTNYLVVIGEIGCCPSPRRLRIALVFCCSWMLACPASKMRRWRGAGLQLTMPEGTSMSGHGRAPFLAVLSSADDRWPAPSRRRCRLRSCVDVSLSIDAQSSPERAGYAAAFATNGSSSDTGGRPGGGVTYIMVGAREKSRYRLAAHQRPSRRARFRPLAARRVVARQHLAERRIDRPPAVRQTARRQRRISTSRATARTLVDGCHFRARGGRPGITINGLAILKKRAVTAIMRQRGRGRVLVLTGDLTISPGHPCQADRESRLPGSEVAMLCTSVENDCPLSS